LTDQNRFAGGGRVPSELVQHLASGEAALMLLECVLLRMLERGLLSSDELIGAVEAAIATKRQMVADREHTQVATVAVGTLSVLANSIAAEDRARRGGSRD
jgi:hypothetical protein